MSLSKFILTSWLRFHEIRLIYIGGIPSNFETYVQDPMFWQFPTPSFLKGVTLGLSLCETEDPPIGFVLRSFPLEVGV